MVLLIFLPFCNKDSQGKQKSQFSPIHAEFAVCLALGLHVLRDRILSKIYSESLNPSSLEFQLLSRRGGQPLLG